MARILIVDDDELWSVLLVRRLEREGHQASFALSAADAIAQVDNAEEAYEILLLDHRLGPGMDGIKLLAQLRNTSPESDAILFTGLDDPEIGLRAYEAGAYRYLHKPFEPQELMLIIQSLLHWRKTQYERNWLHILNEVAGELQESQTVQDVGRVLTEGGIRLGFDRARFYHVQEIDDVPTLFGICQSGVNLVCNFDKVIYPLDDTVYSKAAYEKRQPTFFIDRELGPSFLSTLPQAEGRPENLGEWVILPLFQGETCIGLLNMDNCRKPKSIDPQQKNLLRLFAGQAVSALVRAIRFEEEQEERDIHNLTTTILQEMGNPAAQDALDRLLLAVHKYFLGQDLDNNFIVALQDKESSWYRYRLHIENGAQRQPTWQAPTKGGLIEYVMVEGSALFLPSNAAAFRQQNGIDQVGAHPAKSWMGVPLRVGDEVVGAMIMENDHRNNAFNQRHFQRLQHLANHLVSVIQVAWLNEQEREYSELLNLLQEASEIIPGFNEEKVWLTTLTLCTADYGASFDRAMLFLAEDNRSKLRGYKAIGHLNQKDAEAAWEEYQRTGGNWKKYLSALQADKLQPTPLDSAVHGCLLSVCTGDAFFEVLHQNKILTLSKAKAREQMPIDFLNQFGVAEYCLIPVKAGEQVLGVVVLDNIWEKDPNRLGVLDILDNLTNQAALLVENLRKSKALEDLIAVQHEVLVQAAVRPLQDTLRNIGGAARTIANADLAAVYPLKDNGEELHYDHRYSVRVGWSNESEHKINHAPSGLSRYVLLETKTPVLIPDVVEDRTLYYGKRHGDAATVKAEGIRATIAVPVLDLRTGAPRAMLYLDYHTPRPFDEHDRQIAEAFAHLIATAIDNWREAQGLRDTQEARDRELSQLGEVLKSALSAESNELQIVQPLIEKLPSLFAPLPVTVGITMKEWHRIGPLKEPTEVYRLIYPRESALEERFVGAEEKTGITVRAIKQRKLQNVEDVSRDMDYLPRYEGYSDTRSELDVPILVDGQVVGALNIESPQLAAFTEHHEKMGQRFADITALAIGNARRQRNLQMLLETTSAVTGPIGFKETLDKIVSEIQVAFTDLSMMVIWYLDPETRRVELGSYFGVSKVAMQREKPRKQGAVQAGLQLNEPYYQSDVPLDDLFAGRNFVVEEEIESTAIFPLHAQGVTVGVMFFSYRTRHEFTKEEKDLYPILAGVVASSINDALKLHQIERERRRLRTTQQVTEVISASASIEQLLSGVKQKLERLYRGCTAYVARYNQRTGKLELPISTEPTMENGAPNSFVWQLTSESLRSGKKVVQVRRHPKRKDKWHPLKPSTRCSVGATLVAGGDRNKSRLLGVLVLESPQEDAFDFDDKQIIQNVARQTRIALERLNQEANDSFHKNFISKFYSVTPIVHDINQYTGRIRRRIERLQRDPKLTASSRQTLNELREQTVEMSEWIKSMDLRREELTDLAISSELPRWIQATLNERSIPIDLKLQILPDVYVSAYPNALHRAIYDLTRNALEAMGLEADNQELSVSIQLAPDPAQVEIRIHNNGPAIPPEAQNKLFNDVYSSKGEERGIGLLFVRAAVERMSGEVWLESSTKEIGTTFVVRLNVAAPLVDTKEIQDDHAI